jgi:hypothetical protein
MTDQQILQYKRDLHGAFMQSHINNGLYKKVEKLFNKLIKDYETEINLIKLEVIINDSSSNAIDAATAS